MNKLDQSGIAHIIIIVSIVLIGAASTGFIAVKQRSDQKKAEEIALTAQLAAEKKAAQKAEELKKKKSTDTAPQTQEQSPAPAPAPAPKPAPAPAPKPAPAPAPKPSPTPFTTSTCTNPSESTSIVYVSSKNGAEVSQNNPEYWQTVKTYPFGAQLTVLCMSSESYYAPEYTVVRPGGAYIKAADLSITKP